MQATGDGGRQERVSGYYFTSLQFELRPDVGDRVLSVLSAVSTDQRPDAEAMDSLHPVVRHYLSDAQRLSLDRPCRCPLRLTHGRAWMRPEEGPVPKVSIEWTFHDDEYANGGYLFDLWMYRLVYRPVGPDIAMGRRFTIGWHALYPNDAAPEFVSVDDTGINRGSRPWVTFEDLDRHWSDLEGGDWEGFIRAVS